jgi:hypothetical protein
MRAPLPDDLGPGEMIRSVVLVFQVRGGAIERVFAAEVGRQVGDKRITANIAFAAGGSHPIELTPGKAVGYDEQSYPWRQKEAPTDGFEPLLLPWGGIARVRLRYDGTAFVR